MSERLSGNGDRHPTPCADRARLPQHWGASPRFRTTSDFDARRCPAPVCWFVWPSLSTGRPGGPIFLCLCVVMLVAVGAAPADFDAAEQQYLDGLKQLGVERLLEVHCQRLLERRDLDVRLLARTTIEMAGVFSQQGAVSPDPQRRDQLWQQADQLVERFHESHPKYGSMPLFDYQWAGHLLNRARLMADLSKVVPEDPAPGQASLRCARQAAEILIAVDRIAEKLIKEVGTRKRAEDELDEVQLHSLTTAGNFRLGAAWLAVARAEPDERARNEALRIALEILEPYARTVDLRSITLEAYLAVAELYQLQRTPKRGIELLAQLEKAELPASYRARTRLLLGQLWMDTGGFAEALSVLDVPESERLPGAEWPLRLFESLLRRANQLQSSSPVEAGQLQARSLEILDVLEQRFGRYWGRRGERSLAQYGNLERAGDNLAMVRRLANVQRFEKNLDKALASYDKAAQLAQTQRQVEVHGQMVLASGEILFELERYAECGQRLAEFLQAHRAHAGAPKVSLLAAHAWARHHARTDDPKDLARYQTVLEEHLATFGKDHETSPEAHWLLAELAERAGDPVKAFAHYDQIPPVHRHHPASLEAMAGLVHDHVVRGGGTGTLTPRAAIQTLEAKIRTGAEHLEDSAAGRRALAVARFALASLWGLPAIGRGAEAAALLRETLEEPSLPPEVRARGWQSLLELHIARGETEQAVDTVTNGFLSAERELLRFLAHCDLQDEESDAGRRAILAAVVQASVRRLQTRPELQSATDRVNANLLMAQAHAVMGDHKTAQRLLRTLKVEAPRDPRILVSLGRSLFEESASDPSKLTASLEVWRELRNGYPRGSPGWLESMYYTIACYERMGMADKARQLLDTMTALYPDLGDERLRRKFQTLRQKLGG